MTNKPTIGLLKIHNKKTMSKLNKGLFTSTTDLWSTPQAFFDALNKEFKFTLDPCATKENAKCKKYFDKIKNGLLQSWDNERVFMNPPYGRVIGDWVKKASSAGGGGSSLFITSPDRYEVVS